MQLTEFRENILADCLRAAAARIVGEPPAVRGPDHMIGGDHGVLPRAIITRTRRASCDPPDDSEDHCSRFSDKSKTVPSVSGAKRRSGPKGTGATAAAALARNV